MLNMMTRTGRTGIGVAIVLAFVAGIAVSELLEVPKVGAAPKESYEGIETFTNILSIVQKNYVDDVQTKQLIVIEYLKAENRMLRERLKGRSLSFSDAECALLALKAFGIPRKVLLDLRTISHARHFAALAPYARHPEVRL